MRTSTPVFLCIIVVAAAMLSVFISGCAKAPKILQLPQSCENILNLTDKNSCFENLALAQQKAAYCEDINTSDPFNAGRMSCYILVAEKTGNVSLCFMYSRYDSSAICVRTIAFLQNDSSVCERDDMERDVCYLALAVKRARVEVCGNISNPEIKKGCSDEITKGIKYYCLNYEAC